MNEPKFQLEHVAGVPVSNEEILSDVRRVAELAGKNNLPARIYQQLGKFSHTTPSKRFGSWNKAIIAAGLETGNEVNITEERLFENVMRLWEYYGRQPRRRELSVSPSAVSERPYVRQFRSWTNALAEFVEYANAHDVQPPIPAEVTSGHRTARDPSLRLRFRVMQRDNFSCRACGATPALKPGLTLHVDHIKA